MISQNELNYIETLYLYANLQDFFDNNIASYTFLSDEDIKNLDAIRRYDMVLSYVYDTILVNADYIGDSAGRMWYKTPNYRFGIMEYDDAKKTNQYNVLIQYEQHYLFTLNKNLDGIDLPFGGNRNQYNIRRVDLTKIAKLDYDPLTNKGFISPYRTKHIISNSDKVETVYLGHRKNGNVYRMYDKTKELKDTENYKKMELLSGYFGDIENLYTFELELHRSYLKEQLNITTLDQLDRLYTAYHSIVGKIRIYEDNDHNKKLLEQSNRSRIQASVITQYKDYERVKREHKKPSKEYLKNSIEKSIQRYIESMGITDEKEINKLKLELGMSIVSNDKQDVTIEYSDSQMETEYKDTYRKVQLMRDNQDDQLFKESNKAFAPIMTQNPENLF